MSTTIPYNQTSQPNEPAFRRPTYARRSRQLKPMLERVLTMYDISCADLAKDTGINAGKLRRWRNGDSAPKQKNEFYYIMNYCDFLLQDDSVRHYLLWDHLPKPTAITLTPPEPKTVIEPKPMAEPETMAEQLPLYNEEPCPTPRRRRRRTDSFEISSQATDTIVKVGMFILVAGAWASFLYLA